MTYAYRTTLLGRMSHQDRTHLIVAFIEVITEEYVPLAEYIKTNYVNSVNPGMDDMVVASNLRGVVRAQGEASTTVSTPDSMRFTYITDCLYL